MVATYTHPFSFGDVRIRWDHTNQIERSFLQFVDSNRFTTSDVFGSPKHSGTINTSFARNDWRVNWSLRYAGSTDNASVYGFWYQFNNVSWSERYASHAYTDLCVAQFVIQQKFRQS